MKPVRPSSAAKRFAVAAALLGVLGTAAGIALASSGPPAPTIGSAPPKYTSATSGTFSFSDSLARVTFRCSLDGSAYVVCASPTSFRGLAAGSRAFSIEAVDGSGHTSGAATYRWQIVRTAPAIAIVFPAGGGSYNGAGWTGGCSKGGGACGTASDPSGVTSVIVSVEQQATGKWWNGVGYSSRTEVYRPASLTATTSGVNWFYGLPLPSPDGRYTLHVRATNGVGRQTPAGSPAASIFTIDTAPPAAPTIGSHPSNPTTSTSASFTFSEPNGPDTDGDGDGQARDVTFQCQLDGGAWQVCTSAKSYSGLSAGNHVFDVRVVDEAGNTSSAASFSWAIQQATGMPFTISGNAPGKLFPGGPAQALPVRLTNPNGVPIDVTSLTATVSAAGLPSGCSTSNFTIAPAVISGSGVQVPAGGSVTLPATGGTAPTIQMLDTKSNQDACAGATLTITYSGGAHS